MRINRFVSCTIIFVLVCMVGISYVSVVIAEESGKINVITTLFPLYDWAGTIGGEQAEVKLLLPPGVESHSFDPTPKDIVDINKADMFIFTGKHMEPWVDNVLKGISNKNLLIVDTSQGIELREEHHHIEHPFEWAGVFELSQGKYTYSMQRGPDPSMKIVIVSTSEASEKGIETVEKTVEFLFEGKETEIKPGHQILPGSFLYSLLLTSESPSFTISIPETGFYAIFTEHFPEEFDAKLKFADQVMDPVFSESADNRGHAHHHEKNDHHHHHHHHHHGGKDPHIWLEFNNAGKMIDNIAGAFIAKDPVNKKLYESRAKEYKRKLQELDAMYEKALSQCRHRTIIYGGHFAFGFFAARFGLEHVSPYRGFAPDAEPTPKEIAELIEKMKEGEFKYIFYEEGIEPKVAKVISQETGAKMLLLHGAHNVSKDELSANTTYLSLMQDNLQRLKTGLECR